MSSGLDKMNKRGVKTSYVSTIIGISLVLFMIGIVIGGFLVLENTQKQAKENLQADLFFKLELNSADIKQIEQELKTWDEFKEVFYVSPERAIEEFTGADQNADNILEIFEGDNPLPPTIGFRPKEAHATLDGMNVLRDKLMKAFDGRLEEVSYDESSVMNVNLGFKQMVYMIGLVALLLILIAIAMINNTIRLALYSKRFSIKTMQLVGATSRYIRKPFLIQSLGMAIVSAIIAMALILGFIYGLNTLFTWMEVELTLQFLGVLMGALIVIGVFITYLSTWFALNKYLRMKLDDLY